MLLDSPVVGKDQNKLYPQITQIPQKRRSWVLGFWSLIFVLSSWCLQPLGLDAALGEAAKCENCLSLPQTTKNKAPGTKHKSKPKVLRLLFCGIGVICG